MDMESFNRREKMLLLREELLGAEEDRAAGRMGSTPKELEAYLDDSIDGIGQEIEVPSFPPRKKFLKKFEIPTKVFPAATDTNYMSGKEHKSLASVVAS